MTAAEITRTLRWLANEARHAQHGHHCRDGTLRHLGDFARELDALAERITLDELTEDVRA